MNQVEYNYELSLVQHSNSTATYSSKFFVDVPGSFSYGIRLFPKNDLLGHRQDFRINKWIPTEDKN